MAGLLVGPFTLPNPPVTNVNTIRLLADLGLVLLLFALGLEFGWRRIRQVGLGVLLIGSIEILVMISLGYQVGRLLGWTAMESVFLGAALSISSSAILAKVLRDSGRLGSQAGRLIVGILVVEDFVAVVLLTLLSGLASTGAADLGDVGFLVTKLAIFGVASLTLGTLFVPRIMAFVAQFRSAETMVLASLALCFSLALLGQTLGISAAAGAFLIGAVVGDTEESESVTRTISPIRDMFGALFFVSIGMLIDVHVLKDYLVPALIITVVFMGGKVLGDTIGTFVSGRGGRIPLQVGMGMPQIGEFSLAMTKVGVEHNAIGAFVYQVIVGVTALNSLVYPYVARSADRVADFLERYSPLLLKQYVSNLGDGIRGFRSGINFDTEFAQRVRSASITILMNFLIIVVLVAIGTLGIGFAPQIAHVIAISEGIVGSAIGFATLALCFPSGVAIWRSLHELADRTTTHLILRRRGQAQGVWVQEALRSIIRDSIMILLIILIGLWSIPFLSELLSLGSLATPLPFVILAVLVIVAIRALRSVHGYLVDTFSRTFLGEEAVLRAGLPLQVAEAVAPQGTPVPTTASFVSGGPLGLDTQAEDPLESRPRRISVGEAELIALGTVDREQSIYRRRMGSRPLVWEIAGVVEERGYFRITLSFRASDARRDDVGEEELYIDHYGEVKVRQIVSWPEGTVRRVPLPAIYAAAVGLAARPRNTVGECLGV